MPADAMQPDDYCQEKAAASGSSFYYSFLFLPEDQRRAITALYAFCREVDDIVDEVSEPGVARMKLAWWRTEIERLFAGHPEHPVGRALAPALERFDLPRTHFDEIITGMEMDLDHAGYADFDDLERYCYHAASVVGLLSIRIFGYSDQRVCDYARDLGIALQLTNILRDVREDAMRGRIYLPMDAMERHGVQPAELLQPRTPDHVRALFRAHARRARAYYDQAFAALPDAERPNQRSGIIMGRIYHTLLEEIERDDFRVLEHRIALTPLRKLWIAWRTARRERSATRPRGRSPAAS